LTVVLQSQENSCGPAALATLSHWLGVPRTETELVALAELGPTGLTLSEFARLAHQVGLSGAWYQVRSSELQLVPAPFVAHLQAEGSAGLGHLVAVAGVAHGYVAVADPAAGAHVVPVGTFARRFTGRVYVLERRP
jgi:ABC-type bacteriocin/lantibiotic exporter with double-glycine peptidase domain